MVAGFNDDAVRLTLAQDVVLAVWYDCIEVRLGCVAEFETPFGDWRCFCDGRIVRAPQFDWKTITRFCDGSWAERRVAVNDSRKRYQW